ncbi:AsmA family protein [Aquibium carbonis]|uniref:AsmA family protein n=1 Tax=Aquibium carbonis TaxID=2495581 RepID=A0A429YTW6_9HYPH|nr:AsmA-like C-terminal region-containing protein [Aquibium carbonis]RST84850.1 AsmA family protein [Aquibium carbonis]
MARLFVFFGGLFVLALVAALIGPYFVNWTGYRTDFEREASRILGRTVTVQGDVRARLLPFPSVTFGDVRVAGESPAQPAVTIEEFSMDAELAPFMRGELLIFDMRLVRPNALFNIADDGSVDWASRPSNMFDAAQIRLEKLTVIEGKVTLSHAMSGRTHTLTEINADVSAATLSGPWRMDGSLRLDGMRTSVSVSTGSVTPEGAMRIRLRASPERYPFDVEADGQARFRNAAALYSGTFRLDAHNAVAPVPAPADAQAGKPRLAAYRFSGRFALDHRRLDVPEFRLETGPREDPYTADGTALFHLGADPRFLVQATGAQVRFEDATGAATAFSGATFAQRFAGLRAFLEDLPRPTIPGTIDLDLPAIVAGDTTIRDVRLSAEPAPDGWTVETLSATLPGRTTLEADGRLILDGDFGFKGKLLLAVAQPSGFAAWVGRDVDDVIRRLPGAGFNADVELGETRQSFANAELMLGGTRFEGSFDRVARPAVRPSMIARLRGNALDIDGLAAFASIFVSDTGVTHFGDHDLDFDLDAGPVRLAGVTADTIDVAMRLRDDELEIDRLAIVGLAGANISATASVSGIGGAPSGKLDASVLAADLRPLIGLVAERFPEHPLTQGLVRRADAFPDMTRDARFDVVASVSRENAGADITVSAQGTTGGNTLSLEARADDYAGDFGRAKLTLDMSVESPDSAQLLALYGLPAVDLGVTAEGSTALSLAGVPDDGAAMTFSLISPSASLRFDGALRPSGDADSRDAYVAEGAATLSASDIEPWLMTTGTMLPGMGIGLPVDLSARATYAMDRLQLAGLDGTVVGTAVSGDFAASWPDGRPHLEGALKLGSLDLVSVAALLLGDEAVQGEGEGEGWPSAPFIETSRLPFTAQLDMSVDALDAAYQPLADAVTASAKLDRDGLRISNLTGRMLGGTVKAFGELINNGGTGLMSGQFSIADAEATAVLGVDDAEGKSDISASITANGKSVEGLVASLGGSGTVRFRDLVIPGINPDALEAILARADAIGRDIDDGRIAGFAADMVATGRFSARDGEVPFTIASGSVRTPVFFLQTDGATLSMEMQANLTTDAINASGSIAYDAGPDALVGSDPSMRIAVTGRFGETTARFDTAPLTQFLTQRALEREQARVEAMQAGLLERQRLRREVRYYAALADDAARLRQEAAERAEREAAESARREADRTRAEEAERARREAAAPAPGTSGPVIRVPADPPVPTRAQRPARNDNVEFSLDAIGRILQQLPERP